MSADNAELREERAAIREFDGGQPRKEADAAALAEFPAPDLSKLSRDELTRVYREGTTDERREALRLLTVRTHGEIETARARPRRTFAERYGIRTDYAARAARSDA